MALSFVTDTRRREPLGDRWLVYGTVDEVTAAGDNVSAGAMGLQSIDCVVASCEEAAVAIRAVRNSNDGTLATSSGALWLQTGSGTHDVNIMAIGKG